MKYQDLDSYVEYLRSFPRFSPRDHLKLERIEALLKLLGNPEKKLKGFQVAGTNGKGSVVAMLESVLTEAGYNVGAFYSPHLVSYTERFRINKKQISQRKFAEIINSLKPLVDKVEARLKDRPTWFEVLTVAAVVYFTQAKVDWVVFEVGLGGRLDATTVLGFKYKIITAISHDHVHILGKTLKKITREKAGIIQTGNTVITSNRNKTLDQIKAKCNSTNSKLLSAPKIVTHKLELTKTSFSINTGKKIVFGETGLVGEHQAKNAGMVWQFLSQAIKINSDIILKGLKQAKLKGRWQIIDSKPLIVVDGAHNYSAVSQLFQTLDQLGYSKKRTIVIYGTKARKKYEMIVKLIDKNAKLIIFPRTKIPNMASVSALKKILLRGQTAKTLTQAVNKAKTKAVKDDMILVTGSFYLVGEMIKLMNHKPTSRVDKIDDNQAEQPMTH
ncbi:bifunctional folylpolyglutamate synthase/dihydrofolate synthase [Patescibacteria group bacterium]|nr:bifunctional folylpolyglutamate synthase/dihydrofolate synthase [Patescibacteria group bacterium]MBU1890052.1 bifunctional folylpolyglutamate synthase/dihydrofolate synthase [Patescibacteria group bacterium]